MSTYTDLTVTGTRDDVAQLLNAARISGRLIAATTPRLFSAGDPRLQITVRLTNQPGVPRPRPTPRPISTTPPPRPGRRPYRTALIVGAVLALIAVPAALAYAAYQLAVTVTEAATDAAPFLIGALVIAALVVAALARSGGRHCPGCPD